MTHRLALEIDHRHAKAGWIDCWLTCDGARHHLDASVVFSPFVPLLRFLKAIAGRRFPARFYWDEEGVVAHFEARAVDDRSSVHLKITYGPSDTLWFDDVIERDVVIEAWLPPLLDFFRNFPRATTAWHGGVSRRTIAHLQRAILTGFPARSDTHAPQPVHCTVQGDYDYEFLEGNVFFHIILEEEVLVFIPLFDTHPFWGRWLAFLEAIAGNTLPASCTHRRVFEFGKHEGAADEQNGLLTRFRAEPVGVPDNFRLKIFTTFDAEPEFLLLDEVVARRQFVRGFYTSFEEFLETTYRSIADRDGNTFDLRTLPLDRLD